MAFRYADPAGGEHVALNCSIAEMHLRVERAGRPDVELATAFGAAYELGVRDAPAGVSVEPFPDPYVNPGIEGGGMGGFVVLPLYAGKNDEIARSTCSSVV